MQPSSLLVFFKISVNGNTIYPIVQLRVLGACFSHLYYGFYYNLVLNVILKLMSLLKVRTGKFDLLWIFL